MAPDTSADGEQAHHAHPVEAPPVESPPHASDVGGAFVSMATRPGTGGGGSIFLERAAYLPFARLLSQPCIEFLSWPFLVLDRMRGHRKQD